MPQVWSALQRPSASQPCLAAFREAHATLLGLVSSSRSIGMPWLRCLGAWQMSGPKKTSGITEDRFQLMPIILSKTGLDFTQFDRQTSAVY